jgi:hypothetical protein
MDQAKDLGDQEVMEDPVVDTGEVRCSLSDTSRSTHDIGLQILMINTGPNGPGPWGSSNFGPYSDWSTRSNWRNGPWTAWWGGSACPPSDWPGWTAGPWSTSAPWTSWSGCSASTTATSVVTTTVNGTAATTTAYELQVAAASVTAGDASTGAGAQVTAGIGAVMGAAVLGLAVGL